MSNYGKIKKYDIANGEGVRTSIFFSGCNHKCFGCFNKVAWDFNYGQPINDETYKEIKDSMNEHIKGLSVLGGEPFDPNNIKSLAMLVDNFKKDFPDKTIWCWSGYTWEQLTSRTNELGSITTNILSQIDVLVDGKFEIDKRDLTLKFRGSSNQRIINTKKSLSDNEVVLGT